MDNNTNIKPCSFVNPAKIIHLFNIKEGSKIADFGAGSGAYILAAAPLAGHTGKLFAIDIQKDLLLKLKKQVLTEGYTNVKFLWTDFEKLGATKLNNESLDIVILSNTIFQLEDKLGALKESYRVLKNTGKLYIIDWTESFGGLGPDKDSVVPKDEALEISKKAGFILHNEFNPGEHHYGLELTKQ